MPVGRPRKPPDEVRDKRRATQRAWYANNLEKVRQQKRENREKNLDTHRDGEYRRRYGVTLDDYGQMMQQQGGVCAICLLPPKKMHLDVDHDHTTGEVRGLLCNACNKALGMFGDDPTRLRRAIEYLCPQSPSTQRTPLGQKEVPSTSVTLTCVSPMLQTTEDRESSLQMNELLLRTYYNRLPQL